MIKRIVIGVIVALLVSWLLTEIALPNPFEPVIWILTVGLVVWYILTGKTEL